MKKEVVTLKKMAQILSLSTSTISRALNDHPDISPATTKSVQDLAKKLNYMPNIFAKGFRLHKTNIIGVIVPNITSYFTSTILKEILLQSEMKGYRVIISESNNDIAREKEMLLTMLQFGVDGILMSLSKNTKDVDPILYALNQKPLVLFDKVSNKVPCTQIIINGEEAAFNAVEHLINIGKKRIAIIKEFEHSYNSEKRFQGYLRALKTHNIPIDEKLILSTDDISLNKGKMLASQLISLKERPDAIFSITDAAAVGVIQTLKKFNITIPEEIAVVGFSNSLISTIVEPNLTTTDQPGKRIGELAVDYLIREIQEHNSYANSKTIEIKTNLIIRASTFLPI
ncbi:LacI family DNA-binding transcriptional regulator [Polaribacter sp. Q13]|uniref:LacI family DNA-binding transcriptional regulator n=2 Tax=unclassified Polaribacter TaxID=196858 RepID=UPI00193B5BC5|nr:LacI family DNA-binding transcriptional regulator [Polaribacter sp. Q13]QVY65140.1 LacI family DNA-binding transcriptional regulator [Polaribacter sp. Q13]